MVSIAAYPNNEVRCVFYYAPRGRDEYAPVNVRTPEKSGSGTPLDITSELKTGGERVDSGERKKVKPGYGESGGATRFTEYARRSMLRAGGALSRIASDPSQTLFLTGTLPGSTYEAKMTIAKWSAYIVNGVKAWIAKRCPAKMDMYVWEFQRRGALHLHYALYCPNQDAAEYILSNWKAQWMRMIDSVCNKSGVDLWRKNANYSHNANKNVLQADSQRCKKCIASYLSKYLSKCEEQRKSNHWAKCIPSRLWGISRPLIALTKSMTTKVTEVLANRHDWKVAYENVLSVGESLGQRSYHYDVPHQESRVQVHYAENKEEKWLMNAILSTLPTSLRSACLLPTHKEEFIIRIRRCLNSSSVLQRRARMLFGQRWLELVLSQQQLNAGTWLGEEQIIGDFHSLVEDLKGQGIKLWPALYSLQKDIFCIYRERWNLSSVQTCLSPQPEELREEPCVSSSEQLTLNLF
jgi:hypothetical protein